MTVSVRISVNGNYKLPIRYKQGERDVSLEITGRGNDGPKAHDVSFYHGSDAMTLVVGLEEADSGE